MMVPTILAHASMMLVVLKEVKPCKISIVLPKIKQYAKVIKYL